MIGDEGFYSLAARNVMEGKLPYRDFVFTQMPLLPYVYGGWYSIFGVSIESGRMLSAILGAGSVVLIMGSCHRRAGVTAGIIGGALVALNLHFIGDTLTIKTQSLTVFLASCVIFVLSKRESHRPLFQAALALIFATLAFLTRLSMLPMLGLVWLYLGWQFRRALLPYLGMLAINLAVLVGVYLFFKADGNLLFGIYGFHQEYFGFMPWTWQRLIPTLHSWIGNQFPIVLLFLCATWHFMTLAKEAKQHWDALLFPALLFFSYMGATVVHFINTQSYATHQTSIVAFAAVFAAILLAPLLEDLWEAAETSGKPPISRAFTGVAFALLLLLPLSLGEIGMYLGFDREGNIGLQKIKEAVRVIRQEAQPGDSILTFSTELAVNGRLKVPSGYEASEFTYIAAMENERAGKLHITKFNKLIADIESGEHKVFAVDDRSFSIMANGNKEAAELLKQRVNLHYKPFATIPQYGQFQCNLYLFALNAK